MALRMFFGGKNTSSFRNSNSLSVTQGGKKSGRRSNDAWQDRLNCSLIHANLPSDVKKRETPPVDIPNEFNVFSMCLHQEKHLSVILGGNPKIDLKTTVYHLHLEESTFKRNDVCKPITFLREPEATLFPPTKRCETLSKKNLNLTTTSRHPPGLLHLALSSLPWGGRRWLSTPPLCCGPPMLFGRNGPPAAASSCDTRTA